MSRSEVSKKAADNKGRTAQAAEAMILLIDKLAGKGHDVKLTFEELNLDIGRLKTRLNGTIVLDIVHFKEVSTAGK